MCSKVRGSPELLFGHGTRGCIPEESKVYGHPPVSGAFRSFKSDSRLLFCHYGTEMGKDQWIGLSSEKFCNLREGQHLTGSSPSSWPVDFESHLDSHTEL